MMNCVSLVSTATLILILVTKGHHCSYRKDEFIRDRLQQYQKYGRPGEEDATVVVNYGLSLIQITNYNPMTDAVTIEIWEHLQWNDTRFFGLDGGMHKEISSIRLPPNEIWTPDITPYNGWKEKSHLTNIVVIPSGLCTWVPRHIITFPCKRKDPSEAKCALKFGSWTYDGTELNLIRHSKVIDVSNFNSAGWFEFKDNGVVRNNVTYECCPKPYIDITFHFTIRFTKPLPNSAAQTGPFRFLFGLWLSVLILAQKTL